MHLWCVSPPGAVGRVCLVLLNDFLKLGHALSAQAIKGAFIIPWSHVAACSQHCSTEDIQTSRAVTHRTSRIQAETRVS